MKIAVYGGSFNPPHLAHVMACAYVLARSDADKVLMAPCARHAFSKDLAPFEDRLAMCRLAVEGIIDRVEVSDIEGRREGISFMVDTLESLHGLYRSARFLLVVGSDILDEIEEWRRIDRIRELADLFVIPRLKPETPSREVGGGQFFLPEVSSQNIRDALAHGHMPEEALPSRVIEYIRQRQLYGLDGKPVTVGSPPSGRPRCNRLP